MSTYNKQNVNTHSIYTNEDGIDLFLTPCEIAARKGDVVGLKSLLKRGVEFTSYAQAAVLSSFIAANSIEDTENVENTENAVNSFNP